MILTIFSTNTAAKSNGQIINSNEIVQLVIFQWIKYNSVIDFKTKQESWENRLSFLKIANRQSKRPSFFFRHILMANKTCSLLLVVWGPFFLKKVSIWPKLD